MIDPPRIENAANGPDDNPMNPFAPSATHRQEHLDRAAAQLEFAYWLSAGIMTVLCLFLALYGFVPAWGGLIVTLAATLRVPLLMSKNARKPIPQRLPSSFALLFTSWALCLCFISVSGIAFVAFCLPTGLMLASYGNAPTFSLAFTIGCLAGGLCFCTLFILSLRFPF